MFKRSIVCAIAATSLALLAGCSKSEKSGASTETQAGAQAAPIDAAQATEIFNARCAACHGQEGMGNGPGAVALNPKPRNYHDKAWQAKVTDQDLRKTITYGGAAVGKSP